MKRLVGVPFEKYCIIMSSYVCVFFHQIDGLDGQKCSKAYSICLLIIDWSDDFCRNIMIQWQKSESYKFLTLAMNSCFHKISSDILLLYIRHY